MQEKLIINNFGGIKQCEIEINEFNIFIGPQASGKSIIAKLLYYFKKTPSDISSAINKNITNKKELGNLLIGEFKKYFPNHTFPKENFKIHFTSNNKFISIEYKESKLSIDCSDIYFSALIEMRNEIVERKGKNPLEQIDGNDLFFNYLDRVSTTPVEKNDHIFIPAGRSFFANIKKDIFSFLTNKVSIDPLLLEFGRDYNSISNFLLNEKNSKFHRSRLFEKNEIDLLKGKYIVENDIEYLLHSDKRKIELLFSSSGQQEILPLITVLDYLMPKYSKDGSEEFGIGVGITTYIEEPEAHIFPIAQKQIMEIIVLVKNALINPDIYNRQFIITTHSPYILSSLNNMMYAGYLNNKFTDEKKRKKLYRILPKELILNPESVNAFLVEDGKVKSIIDKKNHLIASDVIDRVSDNIATEFDGLLDVEFEK